VAAPHGSQFWFLEPAPSETRDTFYIRANVGSNYLMVGDAFRENALRLFLDHKEVSQTWRFVEAGVNFFFSSTARYPEAQQ